MIFVVEGELTFPVPSEVAILLMDPNTPEVVEIVAVDEYEI